MKRRGAAIPTRERILDEVERLIVTKGVHGFKLRDVAERLGLRVPAIYKHYACRDAVLVEVSRRLVARLAVQFDPPGTADPGRALRTSLDRLVEFKMHHPAYVRLALVDFATPDGGVAYVKQAAGGSFHDVGVRGPLAAMHARLRRLLGEGARARAFRRVDATDFYRLIGAALLGRLVFPDDRMLMRRPLPAQVRAVQRWLWAVARRLLEPRPSGRGS
jgi:AcrR family transcriptional regulator